MALRDGQREGAEHEQEDEDVVERERLLDQVAGEECPGALAVAGGEQHGEERERDADPGRAGHCGGAQRHLAASATDDGEIDDEQDGQDGREDEHSEQRGTSAVQGSAEVSPPAGREHRAAP